MSSDQKTRWHGQRHLVSIEMSATEPATTPSVSVTLPLSALTDQSIEYVSNGIDPPQRDWVQRRRATTSEVSMTLPPAGIAVPLSAEQPYRIERRSTTVPADLRPNLEVEPDEREKLVTVDLAAAAAEPMERMAGFEEQVTADFSENPPPLYPAEAVERRWQGVVKLRLQIDVAGKVTAVTVIKSSGHRVLDQAAVAAVQSWQGKPARRWGRPVASTEVLPVRFRL